MQMLWGGAEPCLYGKKRKSCVGAGLCSAQKENEPSPLEKGTPKGMSSDTAGIWISER